MSGLDAVISYVLYTFTGLLLIGAIGGGIAFGGVFTITENILISILSGGTVFTVIASTAILAGIAYFLSGGHKG